MPLEVTVAKRDSFSASKTVDSDSDTSDIGRRTGPSPPRSHSVPDIASQRRHFKGDSATVQPLAYGATRTRTAAALVALPVGLLPPGPRTPLLEGASSHEFYFRKPWAKSTAPICSDDTRTEQNSERSKNMTPAVAAAAAAAAGSVLLNPSRHRKGLGFAVSEADKALWDAVSLRLALPRR